MGAMGATNAVLPCDSCATWRGVARRVAWRAGFPRHISERALRKHRTVELASNWLAENSDNGWAELLEGCAASPEGF